MNTFLSAFVYAIIGAIIFSAIGFYAFQQPVIGGAAGAVVGAVIYLLTNRKNLNDRAGQ